jgi:hypothetical protein
MNFREIAANYSKNKRSMMTDAVINNKNHQRNFPTYQATSLNLMFAEWHLLFPNNKQSIKCTSCRGAVCKFWEMMVDEWIEEEQEKIKSKFKNKNVPKKNKTK